MLVSRKDIVTDRLVEYPNPFFKVSAPAYLELLGIEPIAPQVAFLNAVNNPKYRFITAALARRTGKTYIANVAAQLVALIPGCEVLIISPNYSLSQISFDLQRGLIKHFDLEVTRDNSKDRVITLSNGSSVRLGSINQVDSSVGRSYDFILFDEAALTSEGEDAFNIALRPTLDKPGSKAVFLSTPRGKNNWFSEFYQRGFSDLTPEWASIHATWNDNPRMGERDVEEAQRTMSKAQFEQEYMASFNAYEGQIWPFNFETNVGNFKELDTSRMEVIAGLDIGFRDPYALVVVGVSEDRFYFLDEYLDNESTTSEHAAVIQGLIDKWNIDMIFVDSAAAQTRHDLAMDYDISTINAKKDRNPGIAYVETQLDNIYVDQRCTNVLNTFDQYQWDPNPNLINEKPMTNGVQHMADAIRYALYTFVAGGGGV